MKLKIPILRRVSKAPEDYDPYDPKNLTDKELVEFYEEFRKRNAELTKEIEEWRKPFLSLKMQRMTTRN